MNTLVKVEDVLFLTGITTRNVHVTLIVLRRNYIYLLSLNLLGYRTLIFGIHENINLDPHNIRLKIIHQYKYSFISVYKYLRIQGQRKHKVMGETFKRENMQRRRNNGVTILKVLFEDVVMCVYSQLICCLIYSVISERMIYDIPMEII